MRRRAALEMALALMMMWNVASAQSAEAIAQTRFSKGREAFIAGKYDDALIEFRAAQELFASPNTRLYIGRCERERGHLAIAFAELQRTASEAADRARTDPRYQTTRDTAKQEAAQLEPKLGHVTVLAPSLPQGATISLNGSPLVAAAFGVPQPIDPGKVQVTASAKGFLPYERLVSVGAGEALEVTVKLDPEPLGKVIPPPPPPVVEPPKETPPPPPPEQPKTEPGGSGGGVRVAGGVVVGFGAAGLASFGIFAVMAQTRYDNLSKQCGGGPCPPELSKSISEGETFQTVANVSLGIGIAGLAIGGMMIALGGPSKVQPIVAVGPLGGTLGVAGAF